MPIRASRPGAPRRGRRSAALVLAATIIAAAIAGCTSDGHEAPSRSDARSAPASPTAAPTHVAPSDLPASLAAMGDSLSTGFDACSHYGDCPAVSWSTGSDAAVDSIATRLGAARGASVRTVNVAQSGVDSSALAAQAERVVAAKPALVTLLIGGNDVCRATLDAMTPTAVYATRVRAALDRIQRGVPGVTILVASVPDITALLPAEGADPTAQFLWSRLGGCATALEDPVSAAPDVIARRAAVVARIEAYNSALRTECEDVSGCVYDHGALYAYRPTAAQISPLDAFHPSVAGLRELAATEWAVLERHWGRAAR